MNKEKILEKINEIFGDAFDRENLSVGFETTASDVEGWDSLMLMNLLEMIEDEFNMRFSMDEAVGMKNVGEMIDIILTRI